MAQKVTIILVDDLDGSEAEETVTFGLDGVTYEIDLSKDNAAALRLAVARFVDPARKVGGRKSKGAAASGTRNGSGLSKADRDAVRAWSRTKKASKAGIEPLGERGRIPEAVVTAWQGRKG